MAHFGCIPTYRRLCLKVENHAHAIVLHFMHCNFARINKTLRVIPAMEAGISDHVWKLEEIVGLLDSN